MHVHAVLHPTDTSKPESSELTAFPLTGSPPSSSLLLLPEMELDLLVWLCNAPLLDFDESDPLPKYEATDDSVPEDTSKLLRYTGVTSGSELWWVSPVFDDDIV